jgi:hypothetical protein
MNGATVFGSSAVVYTVHHDLDCAIFQLNECRFASFVTESVWLDFVKIRKSDFTPQTIIGLQQAREASASSWLLGCPKSEVLVLVQFN